MKTQILLTIFLFSIVSIFAQNVVQPRNQGSSVIVPQGSVRSGFHVSPLVNVTDYISRKLFGGCVNVSNVTYTSGSGKTVNAIGLFVDSTNTLGLDAGMLITTGDAMIVANNAASFASTDNSRPGDALAQTLVPLHVTHDATTFEFDFIPFADTILAFEFVFGSEEYPEYVNSSYNDVFGFFISGPGFNGYENIALIPGTTLPVTIDNVNAAMNSQFYVNNEAGANIIYDGFTTPIQIVAPVIPFATYHFKVVIADAGDGVYDSGVFIQAGSFAGLSSPPVSAFSFTTEGNTVFFINESTGAQNYLWNFGDGTSSTEQNPVHTYNSKSVYNATLSASNDCYTRDTQQTIEMIFTEINQVQTKELTLKSSGKAGCYNFSSNIDGKKIFRIFNTEGQMVYSKVTSDCSGNIDLNSLSAGIYVIKIISGNRVFTKKITR